MLYYVEFGCSEAAGRLIVNAESEDQAWEFAEVEADNLFDSYDHGIYEDDYEEYEDFEADYYEARDTDVFYSVEPYDEKKDEHREAIEADGIFEI